MPLVHLIWHVSIKYVKPLAMPNHARKAKYVVCSITNPFVCAVKNAKQPFPFASKIEDVLIIKHASITSVKILVLVCHVLETPHVSWKVTNPSANSAHLVSLLILIMDVLKVHLSRLKPKLTIPRTKKEEELTN